MTEISIPPSHLLSVVPRRFRSSFDLELVQREADVGDFSLDLLAKDLSTGRNVIIERRACRIVLYIPGPIEDPEESLSRLRATMIDRLLRLKKAIGPVVDELLS